MNTKATVLHTGQGELNSSADLGLTVINMRLSIDSKEDVSEQTISDDVPSPCSADTTDAEVEELCTDIVGEMGGRSVDVVTPPLPKGCKPLSHQVAGHIHGKGKTKAGLLEDCDGAVLKPIQTQSRGKKEKFFYLNVMNADHSVNPILAGIKPFVPQYYGTYVDPGNPGLVYLKIDDVTRRFRKPCIMDVKIGQQTWEKGSPQEKVKQALLKYPYLRTVGFQILGMRVFHPVSGQYEYLDKYYGRKLDQSKVIEGLARFFNVGENIRLDVLTEVLLKLEEIKNWFESQQKYQFFSSSLLIVYEGDINTMTINGACGDSKLISAGKGGSNNVVSYSNLAISDSESILAATKNLNMINSEATINIGQDSGTNGYVTRLPSYKESQQASRLHNGETSVNRQVLKGSVLSQGFQESNQRGVIDGAGVTQRSKIQGITVAQMREKQQVFQNDQSKCLSLGASSVSESDWLSIGDTPISQPVVVRNKNGLNCINGRQLLSDVKMIDFTHVVDCDSTDENYLVGLRNLIQQMRTLLECHSN